MGRVALAFLLGACCIHCLARLPDWHGAIGLLVAAAALTLVGRFKLVAGLLAGLIGGLAWTWLSAAGRVAGDLPPALEGQDLLARLDVPEFHRAAPVRRRQPLAVRAEVHAENGVAVPRESQ